MHNSFSIASDRGVSFSKFSAGKFFNLNKTMLTLKKLSNGRKKHLLLNFYDYILKSNQKDKSLSSFGSRESLQAVAILMVENMNMAGNVNNEIFESLLNKMISLFSRLFHFFRTILITDEYALFVRNLLEFGKGYSTTNSTKHAKSQKDLP